MKLVDRLFFSTTATGTSTVSVAGPVAGYRTVAQAIADGDLALGETIPLAIEMGSVFEISEFTVTSATLLTRVQVLGSSNGGAAAVFPAGAKEALCTAPADFLNGVKVTDLGNVAPADSHLLLLTDPATGQTFKATVAALRSFFGGGAPAADTNAPTFAGGATMSSSNVTASGFGLAWPAATDAVGVARYEYSLDSGTTWVDVGNVLGVTVTGRTASTTYPTRVRALDAAGNPSNVLSLSVTTSASADTTDPTMSGSLTTSDVTATGYTINWTAGADNVAVVGYDTSIDGGTAWTQQGNTLTRAVAGRPASTTDQLRVRARDAAGRTSNVLSATVTTSAAAAFAYSATLITAVNPGFNTTQSMGWTSGEAAVGCGTFVISIKKADNSVPVIADMKWTPGKSATVAPMEFANSGPAVGTNGNTTVRGNSVANGASSGITKAGNWVNVGDTGYSHFKPGGTFFAWGTPGTWYMWILLADGTKDVVRDAQGNPVQWVLT